MQNSKMAVLLFKISIIILVILFSFYIIITREIIDILYLLIFGSCLFVLSNKNRK